ncbi:putative HTH-type transcriptional regulator [Paenibacillus sp. JJ-100]|uniref:AraC family transcriptional regulator n=1 Tax=Paenibacillus sp. JJ-100 TaxID=2974896 RepID=UPI0022FF91A7|nr:AraC family transcriptional regulator [Paenibacillus sp. JJ-100]CAI6080787.1 putative HTH-type transcriptional regulator [Paenibacillus sp. JJ-100]
MNHFNQSVPISMVYPILKTLVHKGIPPESFFKDMDVVPAQMENPDARIPVTELERMMRLAADYTNDLYFGLNQGGRLDMADLSLVGYVMMHSRTIGDALIAYQRYNDILYSGFQLEWEVNETDLIIRLSVQHEDVPLSRHCVEDMTVSVIHLINKLANHLVVIREVQFRHEAPDAVNDLSPYINAFGVTPQFGAVHTLLRLPKETLELPVLYSDAKMLKVFEKMAEEARADLYASQPFSSKVSRFIIESLPSFFPTLQHTAAHLGMSIRTLQSRLREEGTTFHDISVQVRKELAQRYLQRGSYSVGDIAYALHFSEQSAFQNAFKKWTGLTPGQYRDTLAKT